MESTQELHQRVCHHLEAHSNEPISVDPKLFQAVLDDRRRLQVLTSQIDEPSLSTETCERSARHVHNLVHQVLGREEPASHKQLSYSHASHLMAADTAELAQVFEVGTKDVDRLRGMKQLLQESHARPMRQPIADHGDVAHMLQPYFLGQERIHLYAVYMNEHLEPITDPHPIAIGDTARVDYSLPEVFRPAIRMGAHSFIIAHNHPSGDPTITRSDLEQAQLLVATGEMMNIPCYDSLIFSGHQYRSMRALAGSLWNTATPPQSSVS